MAYEYRLAPIDITGAIKAVQDDAFRKEQLRLKYDDAMNKSIDDQQKLYNGKVRKQDVSEFDGLFAAYADAQKRYQSLNRRGSRGGDLTDAKVIADESRANMMSYVGDSAGLGQMQIGVGKIFKDPTKVIDTKKYTGVFTDLSSMTTGELKQKYGELSKIPTDFEFKAEGYGPEKITKFSTAIKSVLPISAQNSIKQIPSIDPNTGKQKTAKTTISFEGKSMVIDVPLNTVKAGLEPISVLNSVISSSYGDEDTMNYLKLLQKRTMDAASDASNPQAQQEAEASIKKAMDVFGIKDRSMVNQNHLFAASYIDQNRMGEIEIEDWSKMGDVAEMFSKANGLKLQGFRMEKLRKDIAKPNEGTSMKTLGQLLTIYKNARDTGLTNVDEWRDVISRVFQANGLPMTKEVIIKASEGVALQAADIDSLLFGSRIDAAGKK
jgi:hypothetical protein